MLKVERLPGINALTIRHIEDVSRYRYLSRRLDKAPGTIVQVPTRGVTSP